MLREFVGFLRARDTGVQKFMLRFIHRDAVATFVQKVESMRDETRVIGGQIVVERGQRGGEHAMRVQR